MPRSLARRLRAAYQQRGIAGLPEGCDAYECLLARNGLLYFLGELRQDKLVENDFPAPAEALGDLNASLGMVDVDDTSRSFSDQLGLRPLSEAAITSAPEFGPDAGSPLRRGVGGPPLDRTRTTPISTTSARRSSGRSWTVSTLDRPARETIGPRRLRHPARSAPTFAAPATGHRHPCPRSPTSR